MEISMKAIIENIQHFSLHDGPGTRTTVFFKGCPLKCLWCSNPTTQNPRRELIYKKDNCLRCGKCIAACKQNALSMDTSQKLPMVRIDKNLCTACKECTEHCPADALQTIGDEYDTAALFNIIKKDIIFYQNTNGGVTFSGGEMLMHYQFVSELIKQCKTLNIHTAAETSGFAPYEHVKEILSRLGDVFLEGRTPAETAIFFDWDNWWALEYSAGPSIRMKYLDAVKDYYTAVFESNIPVDIIGMEDEFESYKVIIAPLLYMTKPGIDGKIRNFVKEDRKSVV